MPRATLDYTAPQLRETRYVRARHPVTVTLHQPLSRKRSRPIAGRLLGEVHVDGRLHHYRVVADDGVVYFAPVQWLAPECRCDVSAALTPIPEAIEDLSKLSFEAGLLALSARWRAGRQAAESALDAAGEPENVA